MKKVLIGISTVAVVGVGGVLAAAQINEEEPTEKTAASSTVEEIEEPAKEPAEETSTETNTETSEADTTDSTKEVANVEVTRFEEIPNNRPPWGQWDHEEIVQFLEDGKVVYLMKDALQLEEGLKNLSQVEEGKTKEKEIDWIVNHLHSFIEEVGNRQSDKAEYFAKLKEVEQALINAEYDSVPSLIKEAKTLRES